MRSLSLPGGLANHPSIIEARDRLDEQALQRYGDEIANLLTATERATVTVAGRRDGRDARRLPDGLDSLSFYVGQWSRLPRYELHRGSQLAGRLTAAFGNGDSRVGWGALYAVDREPWSKSTVHVEASPVGLTGLPRPTRLYLLVDERRAALVNGGGAS